MKTILCTIVFIFLFLGFLRRTQPAGFKQDEDSAENMENTLAVAKKTRSVDMDKYKHISGELKKPYDDSMVCQMYVKQCENILASIDNYVQRFVSLFLITSNLHDHEINASDEKITIDLEISISGEDLAYLQDYSKSRKNSGFQKDLTRLNAIFSKIAKHKEPSFGKKLRRSCLSLLWRIEYYSIFSKPSFYRAFSFLIILTGTWTFRRYLFSRSVCTFVLVVINSTILWEGLVLYWKKIKETDIRIYVENLQMQNLAKECDPENITWYHSFKNFFWPNKCLDYYQAMAKNAEEEVSLLQSIIDTYAFYLVRMPVKLSGISIRDFTEVIVASLPGPLQYVVGIPLLPFFAVLAAFFVFILCGKKLKLSFFGAAVEIGDAQPKNKLPQISGNERVKPLRKLKPWTKDRSSKKSIEDSGKRWKHGIAKILIDVPSSKEEASNSRGSCETGVSTEVKHD